MSDFIATTAPVSELSRLRDEVANLIRGDGTRADYSALNKVYLVSGKIRGRPELQGELALNTDGSLVFTSGRLEVKLSSAITLETVAYVRRLFNKPEGDFTFMVLRPGSTQGKWSRYNSDGVRLEMDELGDFGTNQGADFDKTKLDAVIRHAQECGDVGILLSESAAYCCKSGTHIQLAGVDISTLPEASEVNKKTGQTGLIAKPQVLAFVNAVSQYCGQMDESGKVRYSGLVVSNRNDQKAAGMRFTMVDGYIDTVNKTGERIVIDAGGGTYKVYHQNGLTRTHLGDVAYDQDAVLVELETQA